VEQASDSLGGVALRARDQVDGRKRARRIPGQAEEIPVLPHAIHSYRWAAGHFCGVKLLNLDLDLSSGPACRPFSAFGQEAARHDTRPEFENAEVDAKDRREEGLDATLAETFPCSDPLSSIPDPFPPRL